MNTSEPTQPPQVGGSELNDGLCDLLPCAHCGCTASFQQQKDYEGDYNDGGWFIECGNSACWMTTPLKFVCMEDVKPLLAEIWNRRAVSYNAVLSGKPPHGEL